MPALDAAAGEVDAGHFLMQNGLLPGLWPDELGQPPSESQADPACQADASQQAAPAAKSPATDPVGGREARDGRDAFVAAISHELRTPLNAILGFGRLARADLPAHADTRYLVLIEQSARLMLRVVNDLLDLTRMESGKLQVWPDQPLMLHALATRVAVVALGLRQDKAIRLYATVDPRCPEHLRGDVGRLEQILLNLVANAMKFTDRGRIVIDVRWRRQTDAGVELRFSVSDTGAGIPMAQIATLGQPFAQAADPSLPRLEGTGLGLMVVNRLLGLHGTQLKVASVAGGGSIFWFDLVLPLDVQTRRTPPVADTCVWSEDARLVQSVATQWCAHGHALLPQEEADQAARWLIDVAHPDAHGLCQRANAEGRTAWRVSADPVTQGDGPEVVELPLAGSRILGSPESDSRLEADPRLQGLKVLVVEDNALNQHVMRELLRRLGVDVTIVGEGGPVADLVSRRHFDVLLLDLQLPDIDGWQVARQVRALPHGGSLPIVFLSAHVDAHEESRAQALGAHACMGKPFEPAQLQAILVTLAARLRPPAALGKKKAVPARQRKTLANEAPPDRPSPPRAQARVSLLSMFAGQWPGLRLAVVQAVDDAALRQAIHALRGCLAVLNQPVLLALARQHEEALLAGQRPQLREIESLLQQIDLLASSVA